MSETLIKNDNIQIDTRVDQVAWVNNKISEVYKNVNTDLATLQGNITTQKLNETITIDNVVDVLKKWLSRWKTMDAMYGSKDPKNQEWMWSGLVLAVQIALAKLNKEHPNQWLNPWKIDWIYKSQKQSTSNTMKAVESFQKFYNKKYNTDESLVEDGLAGSSTITKILEVLNNKTNIVEPIVEPVVEPIVEPVVEPIVEPIVETKNLENQLDEKFKSYKENLIVDWVIMKNWKFDLSDPSKITMVFWEVANEIRIDFDKDWNLIMPSERKNWHSVVATEKWIIYNDNLYSVEIPTTWDNKDKIILTKKVDNVITKMENINNKITKIIDDKDTKIILKDIKDIDKIITDYNNDIKPNANIMESNIKAWYNKITNVILEWEKTKKYYDILKNTDTDKFIKWWYNRILDSDWNITKLSKNKTILFQEKIYISNTGNETTINTKIEDVMKNLGLDIVTN